MKRFHLKYAFLAYISVVWVNGCFADDPVEIPVNIQTQDAGDGFDGGTSGIVDPNNCNPNREPTWENPVDKMMQAQCTRCHEETKSYDTILPWVQNGLLAEYCAMGSGHFLTTGKDYCLRWVEIGAPETSCDVRP